MKSARNSMLARLKIPLAIIVVLAIAFAVPATRHMLLGFFNLGEERIEEGVYYTCPMHPDIRLPQPGECPICGMTLVEKSAGEEGEEGTVAVTTRQVQLTGITVEPLRVRELVKEIDTYGSIDYDETRLGIVSAWVGGRIDKLYVNFTGITVNKGHPLAYLYSPDLISTGEEYLLAVNNLRKIESSGLAEAVKNARALVQSTKQRLLWWGLDESQVDKIARSGKVEDHVMINAPMGGTVIKKHAYEGMYVKEGEELFHIADLTRVWLYADIYEDEIPFLYQHRPDDYYECVMHPGVTGKEGGKCPDCGMDLLRTNKSIRVEITTRSFPGEVFEGTISFTDPFLNPKTRTVRVRVNIENPDQKLKPGMYARARIMIPAGEVLAVPENGVIHSGKRKVVLVEEGPGKFRPRLVRLGKMWLNDPDRERDESNDLLFKREALRYHEVLAGLDKGDMVVTSGNFLLGSESQLQGALAKMIEATEEEIYPAGSERAIAMERAYEMGREMVGARAANRERGRTESTSRTGEKGEKAGEKKLEFEQEEKLDLLLDAYYAIAASLAADKLDGIPERAKKIVENAKSEPFKKAAAPLEHALHMNDIKATRKQFEPLSNAFIAYVEKHKSDFKTLPIKIYCPMADARWLQREKPVSNPYFGTSMLKCGNVEKWN